MRAARNSRQDGRMTEPVNLTPVTGALSALLPAIDDDRLDARTPCERWPVRQLLAHLDGLTLAFRAAADKDLGPLTDTAPTDASLELAPDWREKLPSQLSALALAWSRPEAVQGMTRAGGVDMPGSVTAAVTANELVVHGWDLAQASGQDFDPGGAAVEAALSFVEQVPDEPEQRQGLFGPRVQLDGGSALDRLLAAAGRDPHWKS